MLRGIYIKEQSKSMEYETISRTLTCVETWTHRWDPGGKQELWQWTFKDEKAPRKFKVRQSAGKLMTTILWDAEGFTLIDYLPQKIIMNVKIMLNC